MQEASCLLIFHFVGVKPSSFLSIKFMLFSALSSVQTLNVSKDLKQGEMKHPSLSPHKNPLVPVTSLFTDNRKHLSLNGQGKPGFVFHWPDVYKGDVCAKTYAGMCEAPGGAQK